MSLTVIAGPMFSGKTSQLISKLTLHVDIQKNCKCLIINSIKDNRDSNNTISSHSSSYKGISPKIIIESVLNLKDVIFDEYDIIGIDECQFFDDLHDMVKLWLSKNKHIYVSGLDSDFLGQEFGQISKLLYMSDNFTKIKTLCSECLKFNNKDSLDNINKASFSARIDENNEIINVGSFNYVPMCRMHHKLHLEYCNL